MKIGVVVPEIIRSNIPSNIIIKLQAKKSVVKTFMRKC